MEKTNLINDCSKEQIENSFSNVIQGKLRSKVTAKTKTEALIKANNFFKKNPKKEKVDMIYEVDDIIGMSPKASSDSLTMGGK